MRFLVIYVVFSYVQAFGYNMADATEREEPHPWDVYSVLMLLLAPLMVPMTVSTAVARQWSTILAEFRAKDRERQRIRPR